MGAARLRASDATSGVVIADRLRSAHTHWARLRGLLGRSPLAPGDGLWLRPCRQVHTFGLRDAIDVVFLDEAGRVLRAVGDLAPRRISPHVTAAASVLELPAGTLARTGVRAGTRVAIAGVDAEVEPVRGGALAAAAGNLGLAALYASFCAAHLAHVRATGRWLPLVPILVEEALLVALFLVRRRSRRVSTRFGDWAVGVGGTYLPLLLRATAEAGTLAPLGFGLQAAGFGVSVLALCALGRSLGVVAADRGVRAGGLYRGVRHPLYAGETVSYLGYLVSYPSLRNALVVLATTLALAVRAGVEERFLARDPAYRDYVAAVRWRFVPGLY